MAHITLSLRLCLFLSLIPSVIHGQSSSNVDSSTIELEYIFNKADSIPSLRSLIIHQNDTLLGERFFNGRSADEAFNIKSASKSIIGLLVGIAIDQGYIPSIDEPISIYFRDYFDANPNTKKESITIKNLLTMQSGLGSTSSHNYGAWVSSKHWVEHILDKDFTADINGKMVYSTGSSHLLSVIITKATGMSTKAFAEQYLFTPLDIAIAGWDKDPQGYYMGGNNMALKPSDLLKIGELLLNNGYWNNKQIISRNWIADSFKTYTYSNYNPYGYGYHWWNKKTGLYTSFFAWGHGGQYIIMIPELDAVIVMTSSVTIHSQKRLYKQPIFELLEASIIPFLEKT